jgi:hypothetical protein
MPVADQRIDKWTRWMDGPIKNSVNTLYLRRHAWLEVSKLLQDNDGLPDSYWWDFMAGTYASSQAVAVRRQADTHRDVASLGKLLSEISGDANRLTLEFWIGLPANLDPDDDPYDRAYAERRWMETYGGTVGSHLDPAIPAEDFRALTAAAADVTEYVDKHIAHSEASAVPASVTLTVRDIHEVIDVFGELFQKYYTLFTAADMPDLVPVILHDWQAVFREPWIRASAGRAA